MRQQIQEMRDLGAKASELAIASAQARSEAKRLHQEYEQAKEICNQYSSESYNAGRAVLLAMKLKESYSLDNSVKALIENGRIILNEVERKATDYLKEVEKRAKEAALERNRLDTLYHTAQEQAVRQTEQYREVYNRLQTLKESFLQNFPLGLIVEVAEALIQKLDNGEIPANALTFRELFPPPKFERKERS